MLLDLTSPATNCSGAAARNLLLNWSTEGEKNIIHPKQIRSKDCGSLMKVTLGYYAVYCIQHTLEWEKLGWSGTWSTSWIWTRFEPTGSEAYGNHAIMNCCLLCSLQGVLLNILQWVCSYHDVKHTHTQTCTHFPLPQPIDSLGSKWSSQQNILTYTNRNMQI